MPANIRALLAVLLLDLAADARRRSRTSWENRQVFVAAYWAPVAVYAGHVARVLGGAGRQAASRKHFRAIQRDFPALSAAHWATASHRLFRARVRPGVGATTSPPSVSL